MNSANFEVTKIDCGWLIVSRYIPERAKFFTSLVELSNYMVKLANEEGCFNV